MPISPLYQPLKLPDYNPPTAPYGGPQMVKDDANEVANLADPQIPVAPPTQIAPDIPDDSDAAPISAPPTAGTQANLPQSYPTDPEGKRAFLNLLQNKFAGAAGQGFNDYQNNKVTGADLQAQRDQASANNLLAGLAQSAQKIGNYQGKTSESTLPDFVKGQNQINQNLLQGKQGLSDEGYKNAQGAIKGIENIDTQKETLQKIQSETEARKAAAQQASVKADPDSDISQFYRDALKKIGVDVGDGVSAAQLEPKFGDLTKNYEKDQDRQLKEKIATMDLQGKQENIQAQIKGKQEDRAAQREFMQSQRQQQLSDRQDAASDRRDAALTDKDTKRFDNLNKALTDEVQSSRSTVGRASNGLYAASKINGLIQQADAQGGKVTTQQLAELASSLDSMIKGGQSTVSGIEHMMPNTAEGKYSDVVSFLRSKPTPVELKEYINLMRDTTQREMKVSQDLIGKYKNKALASYKDLQQKDPEKWEQLMQAHGLSAPDDADAESAPGAGATQPATATAPTKRREWTPGG